MKAMTIDCKTGKQTRRELTPEEVTVREADIAKAVADEMVLRRKSEAREAAIERLRKTELGSDILLILGID